MDTAHLFTVPLIIFKRVHHVVCATVLDVRLDLIEGRVLPVQIPSVCHAPTSPWATRHCMYLLGNQQMKTSVTGFASLSVAHAMRIKLGICYGCICASERSLSLTFVLS
jgi:hypothetical protein